MSSIPTTLDFASAVRTNLSQDRSSAMVSMQPNSHDRRPGVSPPSTNATPAGPSGNGRRKYSAPDAASQIRTVLSSLAVATHLPSGLMATACAERSCASRARSRPVSTSQVCASEPLLAVATHFQSGLNRNAVTKPSCGKQGPLDTRPEVPKPRCLFARRGQPFPIRAECEKCARHPQCLRGARSRPVSVLQIRAES